MKSVRKESSTFKPSYWHQPGSEPLTCLTLGQLLDTAVERWGDEEAFVSIYQDHRFTFREARDKADRLAAGLVQLGLKVGDRLGIFSHNSSEWYISRLAAARAGLIAVQLDPAYQAPQLLHSLNKVDMKALIISESYKDNSCYEILQAVIPELDKYPENGVEIQSAKVNSLKSLITTSNKQYRGAYKFSDVIESAKPETLKMIQDLQNTIQADAGCVIQFSSGTTGFPKAALLSNHNLINNIMLQGKKGFEMHKNAKSIIATQFCHMSGSLSGIIAGIVHGICITIASPIFDARKFLEGLIKERCTHLLATPSLYVDMIATCKALGLSPTLQFALVGGAPCSQQLAQQIIETLNVKKLVQAYGMTEISFVYCSKPTDTLEQRRDTVGCLTDHMEAKIVDKEGRMVPLGTPGELWVRGYCVLLEYWKDEEKTRQFIGPDRWAKTGDKFVMQEDGYVKVIGREKDMIIRIADNIFPREIEDFLMGHPDILEAQAFGVPDPKVGEEICVYLKVTEGVALTEQDIKDYCKDKLPDYRIPRYIRFVKEFERTVIGKVQKFKLLEKLQKELSLT